MGGCEVTHCFSYKSPEILCYSKRIDYFCQTHKNIYIMDSIGDYIYLIIIIIAALSGVLKKKKPVQSHIPDSEPQDFEEVLRELIPQEPAIVKQQPFKAQTQKETASIISTKHRMIFLL